ncbi:branched-chain amino acid ABC transporter permease [Streptomyces sp. NPDC047108]|uniref:branched-chain amino acid ABC transporter permease n=1 Tax=Streptomyces sp. NPDC047108 TaxID=3155025 RepID=UPI0033DFF7BD
MDRFVQFTTYGLTLACVLVLLGLGWVVIHQVSGVLNLAQGSFLVVGGLTTTSLAGPVGLPLAVLAGIAAAGALAVVLDRALLRPARPSGPGGPIIVTLGAALVIAEGARGIWGVDPLLLEPFLPRDPVNVLGAPVLPHALLLWGGTAVVVAGLYLLFEKTLLGRALLACAQNPDGLRLSGTDPLGLRTLAFLLAGVLAGIAGVLLVPVTPIGWESGLLLGIKGFIAAALGRWTYPGAVVGALVLGLAENYAAGYLSSAWKESVGLGLMLLILIARAYAGGDGGAGPKDRLLAAFRPRAGAVS